MGTRDQAESKSDLGLLMDLTALHDLEKKINQILNRYHQIRQENTELKDTVRQQAEELEQWRLQELEPGNQLSPDQQEMIRQKVQGLLKKLETIG